MTPSVNRWRTERALKLAREQHGDDHPATYAAFARAVVAWNGRIRVPFDTRNPPTELAVAYGRALHRADGHYVENRCARRASLDGDQTNATFQR